MKAAGRFFLYWIVAIPLVSGASWLSQKGQLPAEIVEFYEDWNYIYAYSTREERMKLLSLPGKRKPHSGLDSPRLQGVLLRMRKIKEQIFFDDPQMIGANGNSSPLFRNLFFRAELVKVKKFQRMGEEGISVKIAVIELEPEDVLRFIGCFREGDEEENQARGCGVLIWDGSGRIIDRTEYHKWAYIDGKWLRSDGGLLLLKRTG